ncbi:S49 family peptidase [uncultured Halomonas sp.]|uniref:S49 family peptidase n=1 Tax=uncultured Halomonas sp. TaxID=173971 RepID=UPI002612A2FB|nr:S49 family peptidase [uncultured Halomonas sp.]
MKLAIWLGDQEAHAKLDFYEQKFAGELPDKVAYSEDDEPRLDKNFNVLTDRKGLSILERYGDKAVVKVHGSLTNAWSWWHDVFPGYVTSYEAIRDALAIAGNEQGVNEIYMDFATGGGGVRGLDTTSDMIRRVNAVKPVYAHTDSHSFSAGYWLASSARRVTASRMAEVGSIGTLMVLENYSEAAAKQGVKYHVFRAGEFKAIGLPFEDLSEEHAAYLQANLEKTNSFFLEHVSRYRNLMLSDRQAWAEGKTFFAEEAKTVGLIDGITTLADLLGSSASTTITSDQRRFEMTISPEKLAQIQAGADPKEVLTADELKIYQASLSAPEAGAQTPAGEEKPAEPTAEAPAVATVAGDLAAALKENGKLEAKLEAAQADNECLKQALAGVEASQAALLVVAQAAVANLQVALGQPKEAKGSATEVLAQYTELQGQMASRFKTGQQTTTPTADTTSAPVGTSFRTA